MNALFKISRALRLRISSGVSSFQRAKEAAKEKAAFLASFLL
ncbi:MAG: hypothetical protein ACRD6X_06895 [Pyrinomonadaceae bacterium]